MPTFFGRKYMRGRPKGTEMMVGAFVLGLTTLILVSFLLTGGLFKDTVEASSALTDLKDFYGISEKPLFLADEANLTPPAPSHEMKTARAMLPVVNEDLMRGDVNVHAVRQNDDFIQSVDGESEVHALLDAAQAYDAHWLYMARYGEADSGNGESVGEAARAHIFDMGEPASAFGIWRARQPADAEKLTLGRGGWRGKLAGGETGAAAFWSGRYYTEVWRTGSSDQKTNRSNPESTIDVLDTLVVAAARLQLTYGGPFWADRVLPDQDRLAGSFRYVKANALKLEELTECWLADYEGGVTLGVMQVDRSQRDKLLSALRERLQPSGAESAGDDVEADAYGAAEEGYGESEGDEYGSEVTESTEGGHASEDGYSASESEAGGGGAVSLSALRSWAASVETEAVIGRSGDLVMAAYTTLEYVFVVQGEDPTTMTALAQATYDRWGMPRIETGQAVAQAAHQEQQGGQARFAEVPGGRILAPSTIERYTDNVYEKINGKEGAFRAFHFQELRFGRYAVSGTKEVYDVYIYDMAEPVNAFGMYMSERSYTAAPVELGRAGYVSGSSAFFWKSKYYVNVLGPPDDADKSETSVTIAKAIDETITDDGRPFWAEEVLPEANRVPFSLSYQATSALTFGFLEGIFIARYKSDEGVEYDMFVGRYETPDRAAEIFDRYAVAVVESDDEVAKESGEGYRQIVTESVGYYTAAFVVGNCFAGVTETDDKNLVFKQSESFREQLMKRGCGS